MKTVSIEIIIKRASIKDAILAEFSQFNKIKIERESIFKETRRALSDAIIDIKNALNEEIGCDIWCDDGHRYQYEDINGKKYLVENLYFNTYYRNTTTPLFRFSIGYELAEERGSASYSDNYYYIKNDDFVMFLRDDSSSDYRNRLKTHQVTDISEVHNLSMDGYRKWIKKNISE